MNSDKVYSVIRAWLEASPSVRVCLPDGPVGKATDAYQITYVKHRPRKILIEMNGQYLLVLTDLTSAHVEDEELILNSFAQVLLDWQEGDDPSPRAKVFKYGEVRFSPS